MMEEQDHPNLPAVKFGNQLREWRPFSNFREALEDGDIVEALRLNSLLTLTQETVSAHHAILLVWIQDSEWWKSPTGGYGPYASLSECMMDLTGRGLSTCGDLMRCWQFWRDKHHDAEVFVRHCQTIGWAACREIRFADIPSAQIEEVVQTIAQAQMKQKQIRKFLSQYRPSYRPAEHKWTRWQVKCSAEGKEQLEAIFDDLAKALEIDRTTAGANDQLVAQLHALYFQGKEE